METPNTQFNLVSRISQVDMCACVRACGFLVAFYAQGINNCCLRAPLRGRNFFTSKNAPLCPPWAKKAHPRQKKPPVTSTGFSIKMPCMVSKNSSNINDGVLAVNSQDPESKKTKLILGNYLRVEICHHSENTDISQFNLHL